MSSIQNFNLGILGHVDSGKTSIAKAISTLASTAAFDKNPQSLDRGITLDLGFSTFNLLIDHNVGDIQVTLIDCPGHASLIKTVIGGSQIMNAALIIIDVTKGIQTQTAECIVLAEILNLPTVIVLNKVDLLDQATLSHKLQKVTKSIQKALNSTIFHNSQYVVFSAKHANSDLTSNQYIQSLNNSIKQLVKSHFLNVPQPHEIAKNSNHISSLDSFIFAYEHCFNIKGKGTILTGTLLQGVLAVDDNVQILPSRVNSKVKSIQRFKQPVSKINIGDRAGICLAKVNSDGIERGFVATPNSIKSAQYCIANVCVIKYYQSVLKSHTSFHVSIGYDTVLAKAVFMELVPGPECAQHEDLIAPEYKIVDEIDSKTSNINHLFVYLSWNKQVFVPEKTLIIGSKLDSDNNTKSCRLAFYGKDPFLICGKAYKDWSYNDLKLFRIKNKTGNIQRIVDENTLIGIGMFGESSIIPFLGFKVDVKKEGNTIATGKIDSTFGKGEKFKIIFPPKVNIKALIEAELASHNEANKKTKISEYLDQLFLSLDYRKFISKKSLVDQKF
ncbi:hypothetical protein BB561_001328 [Smittium simulii]|uniref:Tr-type G domain-containing protein n=1 Tax=Smittium simulii TaxID=133385 RepID=A0A2T9YV56_9FUNG|nr:hypothetical protein BB561_001328 [Smittium simulii]